MALEIARSILQAQALAQMHGNFTVELRGDRFVLRAKDHDLATVEAVDTRYSPGEVTLLSQEPGVMLAAFAVRRYVLTGETAPVLVQRPR